MAIHLGHPNNRTVKQVLRENALPSEPSKSNVKCESCLLGKLAKIPLALVEHKSSKPFDIIHSDVWGPSPILSNVGFRYFVIFIDDFTRFTWIYFLKNKSEVYDIFLNFQSLIVNQFNINIKAFHSDWGGEYQKLNKYFQTKGIIHRIACPYTHEQNGTAERKI